MTRAKLPRQVSGSSGTPTHGVLGSSIREHLGEQLRSLYGDPVGTDLPRELARLAKRLERAIQAREEPLDPVLIKGLLDSAPSLRAFALSLTRNLEQAEDLVQITLLRACDKHNNFEPGTNLEAWLFRILQNAFYSECRKRGREVEDSGGIHAARLISIPDQMPKLDLQDLAIAVAKLRPDQRQALLPVGVEGLSYEDAALIMGVPVGTIKSRVNRARHHLAELLGLDEKDILGIRLSRP